MKELIIFNLVTSIICFILILFVIKNTSKKKENYQPNERIIYLTPLLPYIPSINNEKSLIISNLILDTYIKIFEEMQVDQIDRIKSKKGIKGIKVDYIRVNLGEANVFYYDNFGFDSLLEKFPLSIKMSRSGLMVIFQKNLSKKIEKQKIKIIELLNTLKSNIDNILENNSKVVNDTYETTFSFFLLLGGVFYNILNSNEFYNQEEKDSGSLENLNFNYILDNHWTNKVKREEGKDGFDYIILPKDTLFYKGVRRTYTNEISKLPAYFGKVYTASFYVGQIGKDGLDSEFEPGIIRIFKVNEPIILWDASSMRNWRKISETVDEKTLYDIIYQFIYPPLFSKYERLKKDKPKLLEYIFDKDTETNRVSTFLGDSLGSNFICQQILNNIENVDGWGYTMIKNFTDEIVLCKEKSFKKFEKLPFSIVTDNKIISISPEEGVPENNCWLLVDKDFIPIDSMFWKQIGRYGRGFPFYIRHPEQYPTYALAKKDKLTSEEIDNLKKKCQDVADSRKILYFNRS